MPKFLEDKLKKEYGNNPSAIYGTMNKLGAMKGNKETAKGREMEKKHNAKKMKDGGAVSDEKEDVKLAKKLLKNEQKEVKKKRKKK